MQNEFIEVPKERGFGDVINVSFSFLVKEFKRLGKAIFFFTTLPIIVFGYLISIVAPMYIEAIKGAMTGNPGAFFEFFSSVGWIFVIVMLIGMIVLFTSMALSYSYIKLYKESDTKEFTISDIWNSAKMLIAPYFGYTLLLYLLFAVVFGVLGLILYSVVLTAGPVGFIFFFILYVALFYVMVPIVMIYPIRANENIGFFKCLGRSFSLTYGHWWRTFGLLFIASMIIMIISMIFSLPASIYFSSKGLVSPDSVPNIDITPMVITYIIYYIGYFYLSPIIFSFMAFQYYSLVEKKDKTSLLDRISDIGKSDEVL